MKKLMLWAIFSFLMAGCATSRPYPQAADLRFFHDQNRGSVKFICWRTAQSHNGWQCSRSDLKWPVKYTSAVNKYSKNP